jgi:predicted HicB family RNase H-like nuclease
MAKAKSEIKAFNVRMPRQTWKFLKELALRQELTMNEIILKCVNKLEKKHEKIVDQE